MVPREGTLNPLKQRAFTQPEAVYEDKAQTNPSLGVSRGGTSTKLHAACPLRSLRANGLFHHVLDGTLHTLDR